MEEVVEGFGRLILRIIKWIIIDAIVEFIVYGYGYITLKTITFGKLPRPNKDEGLTVFAGLVSIAVTLLLIAYFFQ